MSERRRIIERIRKCLRLSKSPEPNEAAAALRQAQALIAEHGVSEDELRLADVEHRKTTAGRSAARPPAWLPRLATAVASAFGVAVHYEVRYDAPCRFVFVGVKPSAEVAEFASDYPPVVGQYLRERFPELEKMQANNRATRRDEHDAGRGFADGVSVELQHGMSGAGAPARLEDNRT